MKKLFVFLGVTAAGLVVAKKIADEYNIEIKISKKPKKKAPPKQSAEEPIENNQTENSDFDEEEIEITIEEN